MEITYVNTLQCPPTTLSLLLSLYCTSQSTIYTRIQQLVMYGGRVKPLSYVLHCTRIRWFGQVPHQEKKESLVLYYSTSQLQSFREGTKYRVLLM